MIDEDDPDDFGERPQSGFTVDGDMRIAFYRFALAIYGYRCAITGQQFEQQNGILHNELDVVAIHPRELDGPLEIDNVLVLETDIGAAFGQGLITVDDDYSVVIARPERLNDAQSGLVVAGRKLFLPGDPQFQPSRKHLQFHRLVVALYNR